MCHSNLLNHFEDIAYLLLIKLLKFLNCFDIAQSDNNVTDKSDSVNISEGTDHNATTDSVDVVRFRH